MVSCYVPWNYHFLEEGRFDFTGETDPQRNLVRFLDLAAELNLWIFIRPGPFICTFFMDGGIPIDASEYHRLDERYLAKAKNYLRAVCEILRPRLVTNGGKIILCQIDNEIDPIPSFRGAYGGTQVYNDPVGPYYFGQLLGNSVNSEASFRSWLKQKYGEISNFNNKYSQSAKDWDEIRQTRFLRLYSSDRCFRRDMFAYLEWYTTEFAKRIKNIFINEGIDVPFVLNTYPVMEPQNTCQLSEVGDLVGGDYWGPNLLPWECVLTNLKHIRHLRNSTQTPWAPEYQSVSIGALIHIEGIFTSENIIYISLLAMLSGLKGWNWYVFAERSELYFAPINNYGGIIQPNYDRFKQIHELFLHLDWPSFNLLSDCSMIWYRPHSWEDVTYEEDLNDADFYKTTNRELESMAWMQWFEKFHLLDIDIDIYDPWSKFNRIKEGQIAFYAGHSHMDENAQDNLSQLPEKGINIVFLHSPPLYNLEKQKTDCFSYLPRPVHFEGPISKLVLDFKYNKKHKRFKFDTPYLTLYDSDEIPKSKNIIVMECTQGICGYIVNQGKGKVIVLGFKPSNKFILFLMEFLGTKPVIRSAKPKVLTSAWIRNEQRLIIVLNTKEEAIDTELHINIARLKLNPKNQYNVYFHLSGLKKKLSADELACLSLQLGSKQGDVIEITPQN